LNGVQVSLQVISKSLRPTIPENTPTGFKELITACWATDPKDRPDFADVTKRLEAMLADSSVGSVVLNN
jgi:hypothetical protein